MKELEPNPYQDPYVKLTLCVQELEQTKRGQVNEPRNVAVYLARKRCGLRLEEIGREFGLKNTVP
jgi:chromosomal replication initiation ATPase DnaA